MNIEINIFSHLSNKQRKDKYPREPVDGHEHILQVVNWYRVTTNGGSCLSSQVETAYIAGKEHNVYQ